MLLLLLQFVASKLNNLLTRLFMLRMNALRHAIIVDVMQLCYDGYYGRFFIEQAVG